MMQNSYQMMLDVITARFSEKHGGMDYFIQESFGNILRAFDQDRPTVYVSGYAFPVELLWAFDVVPFDFEIACNNLPDVMGGNGSKFMIASENLGYSRNICSFDRLIIGCLHKGLLPDGDLFLTSSYYCHGKAKTNEVVANHQGKESILLDVPNEISPAAVNYVVFQLKQIARKLEEITGTSLDMDRLKEVVRLSNEARTSLLEVNRLMKTRPCPWNGVESCLLGLGGALFWGSPVRNEIHRLLIDQMADRIEKGKKIPEDYRILWFPWVPVQRTNYFATLKEVRANVVMSEPSIVWWDSLDEENPLEALALKTLQDPHVGKAERRINNLLQCIEDYEIDGVIHFSTPSCYHENGAYRIISDAIKEKGLPLLNLNGDMSDERNYSGEDSAIRLNAFLELLD